MAPSATWAAAGFQPLFFIVREEMVIICKSIAGSRQLSAWGFVRDEVMVC
jgi:hypothetical protein